MRCRGGFARSARLSPIWTNLDHPTSRGCSTEEPQDVAILTNGMTGPLTQPRCNPPRRREIESPIAFAGCDNSEGIQKEKALLGECP